MNPLTAFTICLLAAQTNPLTIGELIARVQSMRHATDFRSSGRLVKVTGSGERNAYQFSMRAKAFDNGLKIFCEVKDPVSARVRALLDNRSIRLAHPGDRAPKELAFENWGEPLLDSNLSYEDLMENQLLWRKQSLVKEEKYGARDCYVVRSEPGPSDRSHYSAVTSWLDREIYYPVRVEKVAKPSGMVKEFIYYGLRQSKGIWSASQIEVRIKGKPGSTLLIVTRGTGKANLAASEFDPALLIKPY